ncbi:hypothetical protein EKI60_03065 [Candidatus Saccharibacteria bacterium]|nr:MAG: hypothetical protein EKI60_03065 [Candidatus Saccharibacteria bacterium]
MTVKTALAMMEGCEVGVNIRRAEELLSPTDPASTRQIVAEAAGYVVTCATCLGEPHKLEGDFACPLTEDPVTEQLVRDAIDLGTG